LLLKLFFLLLNAMPRGVSVDAAAVGVFPPCDLVELLDGEGGGRPEGGGENKTLDAEDMLSVVFFSLSRIKFGKGHLASDVD
jgi:hypothetical protein